MVNPSDVAIFRLTTSPSQMPNPGSVRCTRATSKLASDKDDVGWSRPNDSGVQLKLQSRGVGRIKPTLIGKARQSGRHLLKYKTA
jgi:hypothetical protein